MTLEFLCPGYPTCGLIEDTQALSRQLPLATQTSHSMARDKVSKEGKGRVLRSLGTRVRDISHPGLRVILLQILLSDQSSDEGIKSKAFILLGPLKYHFAVEIFIMIILIDKWRKIKRWKDLSLGIMQH